MSFTKKSNEFVAYAYSVFHVKHASDHLQILVIFIAENRLENERLGGQSSLENTPSKQVRIEQGKKSRKSQSACVVR